MSRSTVRPRAIFIAGCLIASLASITLHGQNRAFDLLTASVADIQAAVASGTLTYEC